MTDLVKPQAPDIMTLGSVFAKSGYFQDARDAAQAVVKMLAGQELGFGPVASMTGVNIIKGKVALSANLMAAAVKRSGRYNYRIKTLTEDACEIVFYEGKAELYPPSTFTMEDAKKAGLVSDNYRKYARNMLFARAMSNGVKFHCPDVTGGPAYTPDELGATVDMETGEMLERPADEQPVVTETESGTVHAGSGRLLTAKAVAALDESARQQIAIESARQRELATGYQDPAGAETTEARAARLFPTPDEEHAIKNALLGAILAGKAKLRLSEPEFQAAWKKHAVVLNQDGQAVPFDEAMDVDEMDRFKMESLRDALRARYRAQQSRAAKA